MSGQTQNNSSSTPTPFETEVNINSMLAGQTVQPTIGNPPIVNPNNPNGNSTPTELPPNGQVTTEPNGQVATISTPASPTVTSQTNEPTTDSFTTIVNSFNSETPSAEDQETKAGLLDFFKATAIDVKGNLLTADGKVVLSADKLKAYLEEDTLPMDAKGNIINDLGQIVQSNEDYLLEQSVVTPVRNALAENFGIQFPADVKFEDTPEGVVGLVQESVKQLSKTIIPQFLESQPELRSFAQHLALGGTPENYKASNIDYSGINIKNLDETAKLNFLRQSFTLQGNPNADNLIDLIKKAGEEDLNKATAGALQYLNQKQTDTNAYREQQLETMRLQEERETNQYWDAVKTTISKGTLGKLSIPTKDRDAFFDYMAKPINDDYESAESQDMAKDSLEFQLLVSYLRYKKGDVSQLANNIAQQQRVQTLSERVKNLKNVNGNGVPRTNNSAMTQQSSIDITTLLG